MTELSSVTMRDVRIIFRNFRGEKGTYNQEGTRNFGVILPPDVAERMAADGWNVKNLQPREEDAEEGELPVPWLPVEAAYDKGRPPTVVLITDDGNKRTNLTAETIANLDWVDIVKVDMIVNPYAWDVNGKSGVKAYLKSIYVTIEEDELEREYNAGPGVQS
jgi:hypothetical protein